MLVWSLSNRSAPIALFLALGASMPAAQQLVRDLETAPAPAFSSNPSRLVTIGDAVYFQAETLSGSEPWILGSQGAETLGDLWPGPTGSAPERFFDLGAASVLFTAEGPGTGRELWRTDGTAAGTLLVKDILPGSASSMTSLPAGGADFGFTSLGGLAYFAANDGVQGTELWSSDGTTAGTLLAVDVEAGDAQLEDVLAAGGQLFFTSIDPLDASQRKLWSSDGTPAGTTALVGGLAEQAILLAAGDHVFFMRTTAADGQELWVTDGTPAGTQLAVDFAPGADSSGVFMVASLQGELWFSVGQSGSQGLWRIDPATLTPQLALDVPVSGGVQSVQAVAEAEHGFVVKHRNTFGGSGLWSTDGTAASQQLLLDQLQLTTDGELRTAGGIAYTTSSGPTPQLIATDGATVLTIPSLTGAVEFDPELDTADLGGFLVLAGQQADHGTEPWLASPLGAARIDDLNDAEPDTLGSGITMLTRWNEEVVFIAETSANGSGIWRSDGTPAGTLPFLAQGTTPRSLASFSGRLYYETSSPVFGKQQWVSDGTAQGTQELVADPATEVGWLGELGDFVFFASQFGGGKLFATDGTPAGTQAVHTSTTSIREGVAFQDAFWFPGHSAATGLELFRSEGSLANTGLGVEAVAGPGSSSPKHLTVVDDLLYFFGDQNGAHTLWVTDGTQAGTQVVPGLDPSGKSVSALAVDGALFFIHEDAANGAEVWRADSAGAALAIDLAPGSASSVLPLDDWLTVVDGRVVFVGDDGTGDSLYALDPATLAVTEIDAGQLGGQLGLTAQTPYRRLGSGDVALFGGFGEDGKELWRTDGTQAGTQLVADLWPGPGSGLDALVNAFQAERVGDQVFVLANDGVHGRELFVLPFADTNDWVAEPFGFGCAGSVLPAPTISASGSAQLGATLTVQAEGAEPAAAGLLLLGSGGAIDLAPGCPLWPGAAFFVGGTAIADGTGAAQRALLVPSSPATVGAAFVAQWIFADPGGALGGIASASDGLDIVVGF